MADEELEVILAWQELEEYCKGSGVYPWANQDGIHISPIGDEKQKEQRFLADTISGGHWVLNAWNYAMPSWFIANEDHV